MKFYLFKLGIITLLASTVFSEDPRDEDNDMDSFFKTIFGSLFGNTDTGKNDKGDSTGNLQLNNTEPTVNGTSPSPNGISTTADYNTDKAYNTDSPGNTGGYSRQLTSQVNNNITFGDLFRESSTLETYKTPSTTTSKTNIVAGVCNDNPDLSTYCIIPENLLSYLQQNYTVEYLSTKIFNCDVVQQIMKQCKKGEWCLGRSVVETFMATSDSFLGGPLCSSSLRSCLEIVNTDQEGCSKSAEIYNMHVALDLLCKLGTQPGLTYECFGHVMVMLHVNLADALRVETISNDQKNVNICDAPKAQQIKHYICLKDICTYQTDLLMNFKPWQWFMGDVIEYGDSCHFRDVCGLENKIPTTTTTRMSTTTDISLVTNIPELNKVVEDTNQYYSDTTDENTNTSPFHAFGSNANIRMLIGVSAAVLIATFGLTMLVCALWKRVYRHNPKRYNPGYSKLLNEESQPLYQ